MAVVRRGKVWQVQVRVGKDPRTGQWQRRSATADTKAEAERIERRMLAEAEANRARFVDPTAQTLGDFLGDWMERDRPRLRPSTYHDRERLIQEHIRPAIGAVAVRDLSPLKVIGANLALAIGGNRGTLDA